MEKTYIYCDVLPENYQNSFYYIADYSAKVGDIVIIPIRSNDNLKVGIIQEVYECDQYEVPWPVRETKHILRKFSKEDELNKKLALEKKHIENQFGIQNLTEDQELKKELKNNLSKLGIRKDEIEATKLQIQNLIAKFAEKITTAKQERVLSYEDAGGIELSADGKTVIDYNGNKNRVKGVIRIPSGVEWIQPSVFERKKFDKLIINKELKGLGWSTLYIHEGGGRRIRDLKYIEVEEGSNSFYTDNIGLYRKISETEMELLIIYDQEITEYVLPENVIILAENSLSGCHKLTKIYLNKSFNYFDENCFAGNYNSQTIDVYMLDYIDNIKTIHSNLKINYKILNTKDDF